MDRSMMKKAFIFLAALFALLTYFHFVIKDVVTEKPFADFGHYWTVAAILKGGQDVWSHDKAVSDRYEQIAKDNELSRIFNNPLHSPAFFMLVLPFTFIPFHYAAIIWLILGHLLLFISLWFILKALKDRPTAEDIAVTGFLVFSFWPLMEQAHLMQPNFVILLFLSLFLYLLKKDSMFAAGLCLGMAVLVREYLVVSLLFILWKRKWRALAGAVASIIFLKAASILIFGWQIEASYWKYILANLGGGVHLSMNNLSLAASVWRLGKPYISATACLLIVAACTFLSAGMAFFWTRKKDTSELLGFSLFLTLCFIVSPWVHECHYVALYIPFLIAWFSLEDAKREALYWLFIPAYLLLGLRYNLIGFPRFHSGLLSIFTTGKIMGLAIIFMLLGKLIGCRVSAKTQQHKDVSIGNVK